jgi:hypothetical protein
VVVLLAEPIGAVEAEVDDAGDAAVVFEGDDGYINLPSPSQEYMYGK